jgi:hypothetical protein
MLLSIFSPGPVLLYPSSSRVKLAYAKCEEAPSRCCLPQSMIIMIIIMIMIMIIIIIIITIIVIIAAKTLF